MTKKCCYCNEPAQGNCLIHIDSEYNEPQVPLCDAHGMYATPSCEEIWERIKQLHFSERHHPSPSLAPTAAVQTFDDGSMWRYASYNGQRFRWYAVSGATQQGGGCD